MYVDYSGALSAGLVFIGIWLLLVLVILGVSILCYVFQSLGYYTVAKRRGLKNPWMAWVPVLSSWLLGSISDQYQYVVHGKVKNKRKWLLGLMIAYLVAYIVFEVAMIGWSYCTVTGYRTGTWILLMVLSALMLIGFGIALIVVQYIALYDYYRSCEPNHATVYLVLSIVLGITLPFFVFACRKKDLGMPPRRPRPERYIPQAEPVQPTVVAEPVEQAPETEAPVQQVTPPSPETVETVEIPGEDPPTGEENDHEQL